MSDHTITASAAPTPPAPVPFLEALRYWFWLGCISFGGPAGQIAVMHQELVERRRWISEQRFLHALNYCMVLPGPEAQQLATYIGWLMHGVRGGLVAGGLFVLPSLALLIGLSLLYMSYGALPAVAAVLATIKPVVVAIVVQAAWRIGSRALRNAALWTIAAASFAALFLFALPFPLVILAAGLIGVIGGRLAPALFQLGGGHAGGGKHYGAALIDDHTVVAHARGGTSRLVRVLMVGLALWGSAYGLLWLLLGGANPLTQMGLFFSGAALVTFGGAYAVLPYVYQAAVDQYHWLTAPQMIDGLALGETTPGPLIMVVAFVACVGGWQTEALGPQALAAAGAAGAAVATFFTFLPSFVFILAGGPLVEATRGNLKLSAPLTAITAAVVGVVLNLALFLGGHVLWPKGWTEGFGGGFDVVAALIFALALLALLRWKLSVPKLIGLAAAAGLLRLLLH